jgi:hypothetical protein
MAQHPPDTQGWGIGRVFGLGRRAVSGACLRHGPAAQRRGPVDQAVPVRLCVCECVCVRARTRTHIQVRQIARARV